MTLSKTIQPGNQKEVCIGLRPFNTRYANAIAKAFIENNVKEKPEWTQNIKM